MGKSKRQFHEHMERFTHPVRQAVRETLSLSAAVGVPIYLYAVPEASAPLPEYLRAYSVIDLSNWGLNVETGGNLHGSERVFCGRMAES